MPIKLKLEVYEKVKTMSKKLNMPMTQCINMLVTEWLLQNTG